MLKSWSIENFKPIVNSGELKLAPVTVLAGKNSSGKSSLIQSILMIAQTLSNQLPDRPLIVNGPMVQLGTFEDILSEFSGSCNMTLKFELSTEDKDLEHHFYESQNQKVVATFSSAKDKNVASSAIEASKVVLESVSLWFNEASEGPTFEENPLQEEDLSEDVGLDFQVYSIDREFLVKRVSEDTFENSLGKSTIDGSRSVRTDEEVIYLGRFTVSSLGPPLPFHKGKPTQFSVSLSHFLPIGILPTSNDSWDLSDELSLDEAVKQITQFFASKIRYLSSLRPDPDTIKRTFAPTSELDDVGPKGEYATVVYHYNQLANIKWYNPQTKEVEQGTLQEALDRWVEYLGIAAQVRTEMAGGLGVTWKVVIKEGQKARTLPEVGGGVNHVLPILVMGLLAPEDTLLIIEEPEATLHARVQALLGDFFIGLSKCKKQCLIETHSENLVSQLRYHIVQSGGQAESDCMIYFVDQDEQGGAKFEPVEISPQGNILNWPDGFFDETMLQEDRITAASIRKRANKAKHG